MRAFFVLSILTVLLACVLLKVHTMEKKVLVSIGEYTRVIQFSTTPDPASVASTGVSDGEAPGPSSVASVSNRELLAEAVRAAFEGSQRVVICFFK